MESESDEVENNMGTKEESEKINYKLCALYDQNNCVPHKPTKTDGMVKCSELCDEILPGITEKRLIETRIKYELDPDSKICAYHRLLGGASSLSAS